jgi:hypothetical protein
VFASKFFRTSEANRPQTKPRPNSAIPCQNCRGLLGERVPLWVNSKDFRSKRSCPLYPAKADMCSANGMSALGSGHLDHSSLRWMMVVRLRQPPLAFPTRNTSFSHAAELLWHLALQPARPAT